MLLNELCDWSSDVCSSDLTEHVGQIAKNYPDDPYVLRKIKEGLHAGTEKYVVGAGGTGEQFPERGFHRRLQTHREATLPQRSPGALCALALVM
jgi:hypothetical protein